MTLIADRPKQCANCGGRIAVGEEIVYIPASGEFPSRHEHPSCPEPDAKPKNVVDRDNVFVFRDCENCGDEWAIKRHDPLASAASYVCDYCRKGRHPRGENPMLRRERL